MTPEHKPTPPYSLDLCPGSATYALMDKASICLAEIYRKDVAEFIVKAISSHDKLVEACKMAQDTIENLIPHPRTTPIVDTLRALDDALKSAERKA